MSIRSPLGAFGAMVVLIQGIAAGALATVHSQPTLQFILVIIISIVTVSFTGLIFWLILHIVRTLKNPALLFNPKDIDPTVHPLIYSPLEPQAKIEVRLENKVN